MAKQLDDAQIRRIAHLARLRLPPEELATCGADLADIVAYVDQLNELNTEGVEPAAHPLPIQNVLRNDVPSDPLGAERALANAPASDSRYFLVPRVLDAETA